MLNNLNLLLLGSSHGRSIYFSLLLLPPLPYSPSTLSYLPSFLTPPFYSHLFHTPLPFYPFLLTILLLPTLLYYPSTLSYLPSFLTPPLLLPTLPYSPPIVPIYSPFFYTPFLLPFNSSSFHPFLQYSPPQLLYSPSSFHNSILLI